MPDNEHERINRKERVRRLLRERWEKPVDSDPPKPTLKDSSISLRESLISIVEANQSVKEIHAAGLDMEPEFLKEHLPMLEAPNAMLRASDALMTFDFSRMREEKPVIVKTIKNEPESVMQHVVLLAGAFPDSALSLWRQKSDEAGMVKKVKIDSKKEGFTIALDPKQYMTLCNEHGVDAMRKLPPHYRAVWNDMQKEQERGR
jgi:hypothetical protein